MGKKHPGHTESVFHLPLSYSAESAITQNMLLISFHPYFSIDLDQCWSISTYFTQKKFQHQFLGRISPVMMPLSPQKKSPKTGATGESCGRPPRRVRPSVTGKAVLLRSHGPRPGEKAGLRRWSSHPGTAGRTGGWPLKR